MRKKLFAILMSAMMMVTFMPTMAFAATTATDTAKWVSNTQATATYDGVNYTLNADVDWDSANAGMIKSTLGGEDGIKAKILEQLGYEATSTIGQDLYTLFSTKCTDRYFYDLNGAALLNVPAKFTDKTAFEAYFNMGSKKIRVAKPSYITKSGAAAYKTVTLDASGEASQWTAHMDVPAYDKTSKDVQEFTVPVYFTCDHEVAYSALDAGMVGSFTQKLTLKLAADNAALVIDSVAAEAAGGQNFGRTISTTFDGNEHKVVLVGGTAATVSFWKLNKTTGAYDAVDSVSYKDAFEGTEYYKYEIKDVVAPATTATVVGSGYFTITVAPIELDFYLANGNTSNPLKVWEGVAYDAFDFIVWDAEGTDKTSQDLVDSMVKTNKSALKTLVEKYYVLKATPGEFNPSVVDVSVAVKTPIDTAAKKEFQALIGTNFVIDTYAAATSSVLNIVPVTDNELVACDSSKTFHVKKAKALKAKKTFQIKNDYVKVGSASYYKKSGNSKITVSKTGEVTVKKGLKKGTYKVKLKVTALGGVSDTKTLKIKVVK